jgi:Protein of unknown function DUF262
MNLTANEKGFPQELAADGSQDGIEAEFIFPFPFDVEKISISNQVLSIETLIRRLNQGTIYPPRIQRKGNLWDDDQQSRLLESMMLRIPIPLFYVAADEDDNWNVVDGLQRLTAIDRYIRNQEFGLSGLEFLRKLTNLRFPGLPQRMQNRILETQLSFAIINPATPPEVQRNVFKRLNTGGLPLTPQEIRHALYFGPSALLLEELVETDAFKRATDGSVNDTRMGGREMILRFIAFLIRGDVYPRNEDMDALLSETMQILNLIPEGMPADKLERIFGKGYDNPLLTCCDILEIKRYFFLAMDRGYSLFERYAYRKSTPGMSYRTPINKSLFEAWSVILGNMDEETFTTLQGRKLELFKNIKQEMYAGTSEFEDSISRNSHKISGVQNRYRIIRGIVAQTLRQDEEKANA